MIAPAMNTRPQERLLYRDLARQQARISRQIDLQTLSRLEDLVVGGTRGRASEVDPAALDVSLQFSMDPRGFSRVDGTVSGFLSLRCHRCAEELVHTLMLPFGCFIVESEALADELADNQTPADVLVAPDGEVTIAAIVEDEILLSLPEWLCTEDPCKRAPELAYPAAELSPGSTSTEVDSVQAEERSIENPFSVLADLDLGTEKDK